MSLYFTVNDLEASNRKTCFVAVDQSMGTLLLANWIQITLLFEVEPFILGR